MSSLPSASHQFTFSRHGVCLLKPKGVPHYHLTPSTLLVDVAWWLGVVAWMLEGTATIWQKKATLGMVKISVCAVCLVSFTAWSLKKKERQENMLGPNPYVDAYSHGVWGNCTNLPTALACVSSVGQGVFQATGMRF